MLPLWLPRWSPIRFSTSASSDQSINPSIYPAGDPNYLNWCSQLVNDTLTHIPWEMCNGHSAVNTINSCNGGDCTGFIDGHGQNGRVLIDQPALWTENWIDWFQSWGDGSPAWQQDFTGERRVAVGPFGLWRMRC